MVSGGRRGEEEDGTGVSLLKRKKAMPTPRAMMHNVEMYFTNGSAFFPEVTLSISGWASELI
jgi:hypothetical protein